MNTNQAIISELETIRRQKEELVKRENELTRPLLTNFADIEVVYTIFNRITQSCRYVPEGKYEQKRKFTIIAYLLFAPQIIIDKPSPYKFRMRLAQALGVSKSFISHNKNDLIFRYFMTRNFREEIDYLYNEIVNELMRRGKVRTFCPA